MNNNREKISCCLCLILVHENTSFPLNSTTGKEETPEGGEKR
nr:MAG TPA: hypothetical protein [Caudoviricetes sp.]